MHTFRGKTCNIHYNSDYSGDIIIVDNKNGGNVEIGMEDLIGFVGSAVKGELISKIDALDDMQLLLNMAKIVK